MKTLFVSLLLVAGSLSATTIDFDSAVAGTTITNQYSALGVTFQTSPGSFVVLNNTFGGIVTPSSSPNYLQVAGDGIFDFVFGVYGGSTPSFSFDLLALASSGGYFNGATVTAYDILGNQLQQQVIAPVGPSQNVPSTTVAFSAAGIHEVRFVQTQNPLGPGLFGIDKLTFGAVSQATPEPSSALMVLGGLFAAVTTLRKRASR
jgi:hypothetical protein